MTSRKRRTRDRPSSNPLPADILLTLPELGIEIDHITKKGEAWALCPSPKHRDSDPSWSINLDTGDHFCFSCGWGGNFLWLTMCVLQEKPEEAEEWIRKRGGIMVARKKLRGERAYEKKKPIEVTEADLALFEQRIPKWALDERDLIQEACEEYGILWDPRHDYWILPIRDPDTGQLRGWQEKGDGHFDNYPAYMEKDDTLFGYHLLEDVAYLEESPLDCVRLRTYGVNGAVSGYGVHISDQQMDLIVDKVETLYVCLDNDKAGRKKEADLWDRYRGQVRMFFANYDHTDKKDHGEMTPEEIEYSLENAISAVRFRPDVAK